MPFFSTFHIFETIYNFNSNSEAVKRIFFDMCVVYIRWINTKILNLETLFNIEMKLTEKPMMECVCFSLCYRPLEIRAQSTWNSIPNAMLMLKADECLFVFYVFVCCLCVKIEIWNRNLAQKSSAAMQSSQNWTIKWASKWASERSDLVCWQFQRMKWN